MYYPYKLFGNRIFDGILETYSVEFVDKLVVMVPMPFNFVTKWSVPFIFLR